MGRMEKDQKGRKGNYQAAKDENWRYSSSPQLQPVQRLASPPDSFLLFFQVTFFSPDAKKDLIINNATQLLTFICLLPASEIY